jgi:hypothetical protein
MTVDEATAAYKKLSEDIFSKRTLWSRKKSNAALLEEAVANVVHASLGLNNCQAQEIRMLDDKGPKW